MNLAVAILDFRTWAFVVEVAGKRVGGLDSRCWQRSPLGPQVRSCSRSLRLSSPPCVEPGGRCRLVFGVRDGQKFYVFFGRGVVFGFQNGQSFTCFPIVRRSSVFKSGRVLLVIQSRGGLRFSIRAEFYLYSVARWSSVFETGSFYVFTVARFLLVF